MNRLPTPTTRASQKGKHHTGTLAEHATGVTGVSENGKIRLSPLFVEWMMGLPLGWTDVEIVLAASEDTASDTNATSSIATGLSESTHSGTPSSHKPQPERGRRSKGG